MHSGYYAAFTGLLARTDALDVLANNLANLSTTGYKAQHEFYRCLVAASGNRTLSPLNRAINNFGVLGGATVDLRPGTLERTGNPFDVAMEGSGFLCVQTQAGVRYTRNGNLHAGTDGRLLTANGDTVLGEQGPIEVSGEPVDISTDGTISVRGAVLARLRVVDFAPGTQLMPEGNAYYSAPAGADQPAADPRVRQGNLESSNLNPVVGAVSLIALQRHAGLLEKALEVLHSDFNRAVVEDVPRVS